MCDEDSPPDVAPGETTSALAAMASRHASRGDMETPQACSPLASPDSDWKAAHALKRANTLEFGGNPLTPGKVLDFDFSFGADGASGINSPALSGSATFNAVLVYPPDDDPPVACHAASSASRRVPSRAEAPPKKKPKKKRKSRKDAAKERKEDVGPRDPSTTECDFDPPKLRAIRNGLRYLVEQRGAGTARQAWIKFAKPEGGDRNLFGYKMMLDYEAQFLSEHGTKPTPAQVAAVEAWWPFRAVGHSK